MFIGGLGSTLSLGLGRGVVALVRRVFGLLFEDTMRVATGLYIFGVTIFFRGVIRLFSYRGIVVGSIGLSLSQFSYYI